MRKPPTMFGQRVLETLQIVYGFLPAVKNVNTTWFSDFRIGVNLVFGWFKRIKLV